MRRTRGKRGEGEQPSPGPDAPPAPASSDHESNSLQGNISRSRSTVRHDDVTGDAPKSPGASPDREPPQGHPDDPADEVTGFSGARGVDLSALSELSDYEVVE